MENAIVLHEDVKSDLVRFVEMTKDLDVDKLEKFIALRTQDEERNAKREFEEHFAELRSKLGVVIKSKENTFTRSKYAPLDELQAACDPVIFSHKIFYTWREESIGDGRKRIWMDITGYGHTRSNYWDAPKIDPITSREGKAVTNPLQDAGIQTTYGQRNTYKAGFGIVIAGEDSDGNISDDPDTLKMDLLEYCDRKVNGTPVLLPGAIKMIQEECAKPADQRDVKKMRDWHKRARAKVEGK